MIQSRCVGLHPQRSQQGPPALSGAFEEAMKNSSEISKGVVNILSEMQERHSIKRKEDRAEKSVLKNLGS